MNFGGRLFGGRLFAGQLFGRRAARAAAIAGGGNWMPDEAPVVKRKRVRPQIQATNMMLIAALLAVAQGEEDGWST